MQAKVFETILALVNNHLEMKYRMIDRNSRTLHLLMNLQLWK